MPGRFNPKRIDSLAVYEREVPGLRRRGPRLVARCVLHQEKTASFTISLSNLLWHCFGCRAGGDAIALFMLLHRVSFRDAAKMLGAWSELNPQEQSRFEQERAKQHRERDEAERQRRAEHDLFLSLRSKLLLADQWYRAVGAKLADNRESEALWDALCHCGEFIRIASAACTILGFGGTSLRRQYFLDRDISAVLDSGFVVDDSGRRIEISF
jgi:hypothetical protein